MNMRQGVFRLWVVASVLFVIGVTVASYSEIREEFKIANTDYDSLAKEFGGYSLFPNFCVKARGTAGIDYSMDNGLCWYKIEDFRRLYPEYKDMSDRALSEKLYAHVGQPLQHIHPWYKIMTRAGIAFGVPLAVFIFGCSLSWAVAGFRGNLPRDRGQGIAN